MKKYINIGKLHIGYRDHDSRLWKKYLLPKAYNTDRIYKHNFYKFYYRWLNFYWCMPRKCECCGNYMTAAGGTHIWDREGENIHITICKNCCDNKEYVDISDPSYVYKGYVAWLHEYWNKEYNDILNNT